MTHRWIGPLLAALVLALPGLPARATQSGEPAAAPPASAAPQAYPPGEIAMRAEATRQELGDMSRRLAAPAPVLEALGEELPVQRKRVEQAAAETTQRLSEGFVSDETLFDLERQWTAIQRGLAVRGERILERAASVDREIARVQELAARWSATRAAATLEGAASLGWIDEAFAAIREAEERAHERSGQIIALQSQLAALERTAADRLEAVRESQAQLRRRLLERDSPPLWRALATTASMDAVWRAVREDAAQHAAALRAFARLETPGVPALLGLFLATLLAALALGHRLERWGEGAASLGEAAWLLQHPLSLAVLVTGIGWRLVVPYAPEAARRLVVGALLLPALRLLVPLVPRAFRPIVYALAVLFLSIQVREVFDAAPVLPRVLFAGESAAAIAFLAWLLRPARLRAIEDPARLPAALGLAARCLLALLAVAFAANVLGNFALARLLARGVFVTGFGAFIFYGAYRAARAFLGVALHTRLARRLRMVRLAEARVERSAGRLLAVLAVAGWVDLTLDAFTVSEPLYAWSRGVLTASVSVGAVSLSPADFLAFAAVLAVAFYLSRFVQFVLEEDVFPRVTLARGVPNAIATVVRYAVLLFGFVLALAAAGVELSRVTLLAGAFGVGIGFGLQNIVSNFVSGLVLLFERPIQVGDTIEMQSLLGEVRRIGARASTVHTFDGAEVIVPNAMLISDQVINWTLSDRRRRVAVSVGVAYGTDPERVLAILREVAAENATVLADPTPQALFTGFGESSLDFELRCWIPRYEEWLAMRSELWVAIHRKLRDAAIEIPFPQRDLHLRSIDPEAAKRLRGSS